MQELSSLKTREQNRYWKIKLSNLQFLSGGRGFLGKLAWYALTLAMAFPLSFAAWYYSRRARQDSTVKKEGKMVPYGRLSDIYPWCVYSPLIKAWELELFCAADFKGPVLEVGIGDGFFSHLMSSQKQQKISLGADLAFEMIRTARRYGHFEKCLMMDAEEIPLPANSIETIIMNNLVHHLPSRAEILKEAMRVLRPGGKFIFTDNMAGWGTFTWDQVLLKKLGLHGIAKKLLDFKLKLFAQNLLLDERYYERLEAEMGFKVAQRVDFISPNSMYLSSLFEFLNLKQGQPTRPEMRSWLRLFGLSKKIQGFVNEIIEHCYLTDKAGLEGENAACLFLVLEKTAESAAATDASDEVSFVCPRCKSALEVQEHGFACRPCSVEYPVVDGIPVFLSYRENLQGFEKYLTEKRSGDVKEYMT